ncbi:MAG: right-handed parallel beta-helix repeat-containing protein [Elusimicrobia bacterium]|nr:right-handed parallel beta-helix repeat-containing protein [Elusimicrobiota bacterium]
MSQPSASEDVWMQLFALLAIVSGILCAHHYWQRSLPGPAALAATPLVVTAAPSEAAAPSAPPPAAPASVPRTAGRWVVDPKMGADADCSSLGAAVAGAREGDVIVLKPGTYNEGVQISKSLTLSGDGVSPDQVVLTHSGPQTMAVSNGRVTLDNLSLTNTGLKSYWVISLAMGRLTLRNVRFRSAGQGLLVVDGTLDASDCDFDGRTALSVSGKSKVRLVHATLTGEESAVSADGGGVDLRIESSRIQDSRGTGLEASRFALVRMNDVTLSGNVSAAVAIRSGAEVRITQAKIVDNRDCGVRIEGGGKVVLEQVQLSRDRCGVGFTGLGSLEARNSQFSELALGAVAVKPGLEKSVTIRGSGNVGLKIPGERGKSED